MTLAREVTPGIVIRLGQNGRATRAGHALAAVLLAASSAGLGSGDSSADDDADALATWAFARPGCCGPRPAGPTQE